MTQLITTTLSGDTGKNRKRGSCDNRLFVGTGICEKALDISDLQSEDVELLDTIAAALRKKNSKV